MPTYEYRCANGHEFERFQKMSDDPVDTCPDCGAAAERLLSTGAGLVFKGSGFYITDYRDADYQKKASSESGGASDANAEGASAKKDTDAEKSPGGGAMSSERPAKPKAESSGGGTKGAGDSSKTP